MAMSKTARKNLKAARDRLRELEEKHGRLTPDLVIKDARNPSSPLHSCFEWNVKKAALAYWREQARDLIASVRYLYTVEDKTYSAPEFVRDPSVPPGKQGYISIPKLRKDEDLSRAALVDEFARAAAALRRAHEIAAALKFKPNEIKRIEQQIIGLRRQAEQAGRA